ncbi:MAG: helix-turn-helix transcriptional regulator [Acidobacteria bacterium]|nr:helix-turn-helix transcriptional regulator [Acidobacteriota bacterium]
MSVGEKILKARLESKRTQRDVARLTGLAVSYLSRLENDRLNPSLRSLTTIANALGIPLASLLDSGPVLEPRGCCPVTSSGRCILDQLNVRPPRGRKGTAGKSKTPAEGYSTRQLQLLRMCNFLLHEGDAETVMSLSTVIRSLRALVASNDQTTAGK